MNERYMAAYIVAFEINDQTRLTTFKTELRKLYPAVCPINNTAWAIVTDKKATEIRESLSPHIELTTDRVFVIRSGTEAAWRNSYGKDHDEWLKKYL